MHLDAVQEIERAIDALSPQQLDELLVWIDERYSRSVEGQLKKELASGRFDGRIERALGDHKSGKTKAL